MTDIRPAARAELDEVLALWHRARSAHAVTPDNHEVLTRLLDHDPDALLIALDGGRIVGSVIAAWDGWRGNLYRLAVAPEHRRRGTGRALVREGERRIRRRGGRRVSALVGRGDERAAALWTAAGYEHDPAIDRFVHDLP